MCGAALRAQTSYASLYASPFTQEIVGSNPTGNTCPNDFSDPIDQAIRTQCALSWKIHEVVSEWWSVIAVSQRPLYQTGRTVHVHTKHYEYNVPYR